VQVLKDDEGNSWPPVSNMRRKEKILQIFDPDVIGSQVTQPHFIDSKERKCI
jgi:hypothetical protein